MLLYVYSYMLHLLSQLQAYPWEEELAILPGATTYDLSHKQELTSRMYCGSLASDAVDQAAWLDSQLPPSTTYSQLPENWLHGRIVSAQVVYKNEA